MSSSCSRASFVELGGRRNLFQHHDETRLWARFVQGVCHAVIQRIKVLAKVRWKGELRGNQVQHILLGLCMGQIGIQKMVTDGVAASCRSCTRKARMDCTMLGRTPRRAFPGLYEVAFASPLLFLNKVHKLLTYRKAVQAPGGRGNQRSRRAPPKLAGTHRCGESQLTITRKLA